MSEAKESYRDRVQIEFATLDLATETTNANTRSYVLSSDTETTSKALSIISKAIAKEKRLDAYTQRVATRIPRETRLYP